MAQVIAGIDDADGFYAVAWLGRLIGLYGANTIGGHLRHGKPSEVLLHIGKVGIVSEAFQRLAGNLNGKSFVARQVHHDSTSALADGAARFGGLAGLKTYDHPLYCGMGRVCEEHERAQAGQ